MKTIFEHWPKSAHNNLGKGPRRCKSLPQHGLITTVKVVTGEFITPQPIHIAKARRSPVLKTDVAASVAA